MNKLMHSFLVLTFGLCFAVQASEEGAKTEATEPTTGSAETVAATTEAEPKAAPTKIICKLGGDVRTIAKEFPEVVVDRFSSPTEEASTESAPTEETTTEAAPTAEEGRTPDQSGGCEVSYTRFGESQIIANAKWDLTYCDSTMAKVQTNLEAAGFECVTE